ncbi:hypothetical protein ACFOZ7_04030 [Natribaculum luteum]|uniref:Uncharacterized protein n=1 Tax=Natribaculum luteum TaxID=1586232 RepID=A0ABD5NVR4_9EURY|nr:hypothetical protein [Natribaculum luteum]
MANRDEDLAESIDELTQTLRDLRHELEPRPEPRLRPPTPGELLRLTDEVAIPALVAILEANVRALEAFQRGLRLVRRDRDVRERTGRATDVTRTRATELRETTLEQLDGALAELQRALGEGALPQNRQARDLVEDARELRDEVDRRLRDAGEEVDAETKGRTIEIDDSTDDRPDESDVDVDAELETLKDQYGSDDAGDETDGDEPDDETGENES